MTFDNETPAAFDEDALEEAYERALSLEKAGDFEAASLAYRDVLQIDPSDHAGAAVRLASMGMGDVPLKAPDAYVATLFDQHADMFDTILVDQLGYDVPLQLRDILLDIDENFQCGRMLDLGCGTGLSADALDDLATHKTGVDISENMIEIAYEKGDYDALFVSEVVLFLQKNTDEAWDLIVATDVLPYMGALEDFFVGLKANINQRGVIAFSSETQKDEIFQGRDYMVGAYQRFAHAEKYLRRMMDLHGFECLACKNIIVRHEQGQPVSGQLIVARSI